MTSRKKDEMIFNFSRCLLFSFLLVVFSYFISCIYLLEVCSLLEYRTRRERSNYKKKKKKHSQTLILALCFSLVFSLPVNLTHTRTRPSNHRYEEIWISPTFFRVLPHVKSGRSTDVSLTIYARYTHRIPHLKNNRFLAGKMRFAQ